MAAHGAGGGIALPQPLAPSDAARIRRIFAMQARGDLATAARETASLSDQLLTGSILADRFLGRFGKATADELSAWLDQYAEQPDAPSIYALLLRRLPKGHAAPPVPRVAAIDAREPGPNQVAEDDPPDLYPVEATPSPNLWHAVIERARAGNAGAALLLIMRTRGLTGAQISRLRGDVAQVLFTQNRDADALDIAASAEHTPADQDTGLAALMGGLAAWRLDLPYLAVGYFERAGRAPMAAPAIRAAGAFWAARANRHLGHDEMYGAWLKRAAVQQGTFYGLLSQRLLGTDGSASTEYQTLSQADADAIAGLPGGQRAFALLQVGEEDRAEAELRGLWPLVKDNPPLLHSLLLISAHADFPILRHNWRRFSRSRAPAPCICRCQGCGRMRVSHRSCAGLRADPSGIEFRRGGGLRGRGAWADADHAGDGTLYRRAIQSRGRGIARSRL